MLGVEHKASTDAIQSAYARLSEKFHPKTGITPDLDKYEGITLAFEVLSDPDLRKDFDKLKGIGGEEKPRFSGRKFFEDYGRDTNLRVAMLSVLYDRRRSKPFTPSLSMRHLESILSASSEELNFALWYLKQRDMVVMDDKSSMGITTDGMDYLQAHPPNPDDVMKLIRDNAPPAPEPAPTASASLLKLETAVEQAAPEAPVAEAPANPVINNTAARIGSLLAKRK